MIKKYKVRYSDGDCSHCGEVEIEVLQLPAESDKATFLAAMNEARAQILEKLGYEFNVTEIKP